MARRSRGSRTGGKEEFFAPTRRVPRPESIDVIRESDEIPGIQRFMTVPESYAAVYPWQPLRPLRVYNVPHSRGFGTGTSQAKRLFPAERLAFKMPGRVKACVMRKERRQVLFALGRAGYRGSARKRHWRRTEDSNWRC